MRKTFKSNKHINHLDSVINAKSLEDEFEAIELKEHKDLSKRKSLWFKYARYKRYMILTVTKF